MANTIISFKEVIKRYDDDEPVLKKSTLISRKGVFILYWVHQGVGKQQF